MCIRDRYSPASVSAADSSAVQELAHSLKARVGMAAEMLDTGETVAVGDEADYPCLLYTSRQATESIRELWNQPRCWSVASR